MSTELEVVSTAIANLNKVATGLADLSKQYKGVVFEVGTSKGMEEAKAARVAIRQPRYEVERIRKDAKAPILALGKKLDDEAKRITGELLKLEEPIDQQIKAEDERKERERQAKIDAEQKRVADLQERVAELRGNRMLSATSGSVLISEHIGDLERIPIDATFQEYMPQAHAAKDEGLAWLRELHTAATNHEIEQARLKEEREELARLRGAEELRQAQERERLAEEQRAARKAAEAEAARNAEQLRKQRAEQEAAAKAERERIAVEEKRLADERAEFQRQQREAAEAREKEERERAEQARIAALKRPDDSEIIGVLSKHYRAPEAKVIEWLAATNWKKARAA